MDSSYKQVEITPDVLCGTNEDVTCFYFTNNPTSSKFKGELPRWNEFIKYFYAELGRE